MAYNFTKLTAYAMISSLEEDLRKIIKNYIESKNLEEKKEFSEIFIKANNRIEKDIGGKYDDISYEDLIEYIDLGEAIQIISAHTSLLPKNITVSFKKNIREIEGIIAIRNRVMHSRPLKVDDPIKVSSICEKLSTENPLDWPNINNTINKLHADSTYVLSLNIKNLDDTYKNHNLPTPDYDETGLIGRDNYIKDIKKLCLTSPYPTISIVGEGGVGKTALALQVAYEILEESDLYDIIIWVSSKTTQISINEIKQIENAITNSIGLFGEISHQLAGNLSSQSIEDKIQEIIEYFSEFKVLLFIDNLETILDDRIRSFVGNIPQGSKIVITSRIGLGAYEYPIRLKGLEENDASQLLRKVAQIRQVDILAKCPERTLISYSKRMNCNPSYIKWFVNCVATGKQPEEILQNSELFLDFCMSNVYEYLSNDAKTVLTAMQCAPGYKDIPELAYLTDFEALKIRNVVHELLSTNILNEYSKLHQIVIRPVYQLSELAFAYLQKHHRPTLTSQRNIQVKLNQLNAIFENQRLQNDKNRYYMKNIHYRDKLDRVIVKKLHHAFQAILNDDLDKSYEILKESYTLAPDFFEVARLQAFYFTKMGNFHEAREKYELAIQLSNGLPQIHYWYAKFLLESMRDVDSATLECEKALQKDNKAIDVHILLSRCYLYQHEYKKCINKLAELHKLEGLDNRHKKVIYDLNIQVSYRQADDNCSLRNYDDSLNFLIEMKAKFDKIPEDYIDAHTIKRIKKSKVTIKNLGNNLTSKSQIKQLNSIESWVNEL